MYAQTDRIVKRQNWKSYHQLHGTNVRSQHENESTPGEGLVPTPIAQLRINGLESSMLTKTQMKSAGTIPDFLMNFTDND